jgi:serine/threonine protein kinase
VGAPPKTRLLYSGSGQPSAIGCLTPEQAIAFVAQASGALPDPDVQAHLDHCEGCRLVVGEAARSLTASSAVRESRPKPRPLTLRVGEIVAARYEILRHVASGGMGEVYEARDDTLREVVALKTLQLTEIDDSNAVARLRREVRLARKVTHPNVCRILEFGQHQPTNRPGESIPFLTMDLLAGDTLAAKIASEGRFSSTRAANLLEDVLAGVGAVHAAGIVHRDIKPQNIFLLPGPPERALVMDFGLARRLSPTQSAITGGSIVGTADYMAPEQVKGAPPHRAFDIYALGVVIFEMLTGQKPFPTQSLASLAGDGARRTPLRPSTVTPGLDPRWDDIVLRCLAFEPGARFSRVEDIAAKLRCDILGMPVAPKRRPSWHWGIAVLAALVLFASGYLIVGRVLANRARGVAEVTAPRSLAQPLVPTVKPVASVAPPPRHSAPDPVSKPAPEPTSAVSASPPAVKHPVTAAPVPSLSSSPSPSPSPSEPSEPDLLDDRK